MNHLLTLIGLFIAPMAIASADEAASAPPAETTEQTETENTEDVASATDAAPPSPEEGFVELPINRVTVKRRAQPKWPAAGAGTQGTICEVTMYVDAKGKPVRAVSICGLPQFEKSASAAAMKWRFEPHLVDGKPTGFKWKLKIKFKRK